MDDVMDKHQIRPELENGNAAQFISNKAIQYLNGVGLDVGCNRWKIKPDSIGVDLVKKPGVDLIVRNWDSIPSNNYDYLFSSHCLEHIEDWKTMLSHWARVVKEEGIVFLYLPDPSKYNRWSKRFMKVHKHDFTLRQIVYELLRLEIKVIEKGHDEYAGMYVAGRKHALKIFI